MTPVDGQDGKNRPSLRTAKRHRLVLHEDLCLSKDAKLHGRPPARSDQGTSGNPADAGRTRSAADLGPARRQPGAAARHQPSPSAAPARGITLEPRTRWRTHEAPPPHPIRRSHDRHRSAVRGTHGQGAARGRLLEHAPGAPSRGSARPGGSPGPKRRRGARRPGGCHRRRCSRRRVGGRCRRGRRDARGCRLPSGHRHRDHVGRGARVLGGGGPGSRRHGPCTSRGVRSSQRMVRGDRWLRGRGRTLPCPW